MEYVPIVMKLVDIYITLYITKGYRLAMLTGLVVHKQVKDKSISFILDPSSD